jgi:hypothetical protein
MDRKRMSLVLVSAAVVVVAVTAVTASPEVSDTPLYTYRMEQASSKMNFSPVTSPQFTYSAESEFALDYTITACCGVQLLDVKTISTCVGETCETCWSTCVNTCENTCVYTCYTCVNTCGLTCVSTCSTCVSTCWNTCVSTCPNTCWNTCDVCS